MSATGSTPSPERVRGFTLVEIAIVVFLITILLGSILVPLYTQVEQRQLSETQKMLEDIREALIGYAVARGHLPCPDRTAGGGGGANDTANDGVEDLAAGVCTNIVGPTLRVIGNVPWVTLGLGASDLWGNRIRYVLTPGYAQRPPAAFFNLSSAAVLTVSGSGSLLPLTPDGPDGAVAVIISHGKNGLGAMNAHTNTARPAPLSTDEVNNTSGTDYISRPPFRSGNPNTEFDDIVTWLGKYTLFSRMVTAGRLP